MKFVNTIFILSAAVCIQCAVAGGNTCNTVQSGNWSDNTTWFCSTSAKPDIGSYVTISSGHEIVLDEDTAELNSLGAGTGSGMKLIVTGDHSLNAITGTSLNSIDLSNILVVLQGNLDINAYNHNISMGQVNGAGYLLNLNSDNETRLTQSIGSSLTTDAVGVTVFDIPGGGINSGNFSIKKTKIFNDNVLLKQNLSFASNTEGGYIEFNGTVDSDTSVYRALIGESLLRNSTIVFNGDVGRNRELNKIEFSGNFSNVIQINTSFIKSINNIGLPHSILLGSAMGAVTLESTNGGTVSLGAANKYLRSAVGLPNSLIINSTQGKIQINNDSVGDNSQPLSSISMTSLNGITLKTSTITTTGNQDYNDNITLANNAELIGTVINFSGDVDNAGFDLTINDSSLVIPSSLIGTVSGSGDLIKQGAGVLELHSILSLTGNIFIDQGGINNATIYSSPLSSIALLSLGEGTFSSLNSTSTDSFELFSGTTLQGSGVCNCNLYAGEGVSINPGFSPGVLTFDSFFLDSGSTLEMELNGTMAGTEYDQVFASDANLGYDNGPATLKLTLGYSPGIGDSYTIVNNTGVNPVQETFLGLPEGQQFVAGDTLFCITYSGGDGNDVVITAVGGSVIYVDKDAPSMGDGTSWATAFNTLQDALADASSGSGQQVWVADGVYYPDESDFQINDDITAAFSLVDGVSVYGGFNGTETELSQSNPDINVTILSGDITQNDINTDGNNIAESTGDIFAPNSYHILNGSAVDTNTLFDGFTVTAGYAGGVNPDNGGAGMYCGDNQSGPSINQVQFIGSFANVSGAATLGCSQMVTNSSFINNEIEAGTGGAVHASGGFFDKVEFSGNSTQDTVGGALSNTNFPLTITNSSFISNWANSNLDGAGGAIWTQGELTMDNILFLGNKAVVRGGAIYLDGADASLTNVTMTGNRGDDFGGAICSSETSTATINIVNSVIWNNFSNGGSVSMSIDIPATVILNYSYSLIQGFGTTGTGNLDEDPIFVLDADPSTAPNSIGNARLMSVSNAIDAGDNSVVIEAYDLDGNDRILDGTVDMGAYEYDSDLIFENGFD